MSGCVQGKFVIEAIVQIRVAIANESDRTKDARGPSMITTRISQTGCCFTDLYLREKFPYDTFEYTHCTFQLVRLSLFRQSERFTVTVARGLAHIGFTETEAIVTLLIRDGLHRIEYVAGGNQ